MHNQVAQGDFTYLQQLRAMPTPNTAACVRETAPDGMQEESSSDEEGDSDDLEDEDDEDGDVAMDEVDMQVGSAPEQQRAEPVIDEDGFQLVQRKGRRQR